MTSPLLLPNIFSIVALIPIGLMTLFGGERGGQLACQRKFPESAGYRPSSARSGRRSSSGRYWACAGPFTMSSILLIQMIYKTLWMLVFVLHRRIGGRSGEVLWGISLTFLVIVLSYAWIIPRRQVFGDQ